MRELTKNEATQIKAGAGHYHWICRDGQNYISQTQFASAQAAGAAADAHIKRYPAHAKRVSVFYCEKNH